MHRPAGRPATPLSIHGTCIIILFASVNIISALVIFLRRIFLLLLSNIMTRTTIIGIILALLVRRYRNIVVVAVVAAAAGIGDIVAIVIVIVIAILSLFARVPIGQIQNGRVRSRHFPTRGPPIFRHFPSHRIAGHPHGSVFQRLGNVVPIGITPRLRKSVNLPLPQAQRPLKALHAPHVGRLELAPRVLPLVRRLMTLQLALPLLLPLLPLVVIIIIIVTTTVVVLLLPPMIVLLPVIIVVVVVAIIIIIIIIIGIGEGIAVQPRDLGREYEEAGAVVFGHEAVGCGVVVVGGGEDHAWGVGVGIVVVIGIVGVGVVLVFALLAGDEVGENGEVFVVGGEGRGEGVGTTVLDVER